MRWMEYLRDKAVFLLFDAFLLVAVILLFYLLSVGTMIIVFFGCIFLACMVVPLIVEYRKRKAFYENFIEMLDSLERKNLIAEMVKRPDFREGMILYDALKTSNKAMLEEIRKYSKAQKEYQEYIEMWVHEIKTPIASSRLILENSDGFAGADGLGEDLSALENLVEQVLFYARSNAVEKDYMVRKANLREIVYAAARRNAKQLIGRKIRFEAELPDIIVYTDAKWIEFILNQILGNAIKYSDKADAQIIITAKENPNSVVLSISDNGIGIPAVEVGRIFEKGFTGSNGRKKEKSTGMGLYLCAKLCDRLGHGIAVSSTEGEGTAISITFPKSSMTDI